VWHGRRTACTHHYAAGKGVGRRSFRLRAVRRSSAPRQLLLVIGETTDFWPAAAYHEGPADIYPCSFCESPIPMWVYDTDSLQFLDVNATVVASPVSARIWPSSCAKRSIEADCGRLPDHDTPSLRRHRRGLEADLLVVAGLVQRAAMKLYFCACAVFKP